MAEASQFSHGRRNYLFHGHRSDALEAAGRLQNIHTGMAGRIRRVSWPSCRHHDLRLLRSARTGSSAKRSLSSWRSLRVLERIQLARCCCARIGSRNCAGRPGGSLTPGFVRLFVVRGILDFLSVVLRLDEVSTAGGTFADGGVTLRLLPRATSWLWPFPGMQAGL